MAVPGSDDEIIGLRIRALREAKGMSQAQLASAVSAAGGFKWVPQTVTKIESGDRSVKLAEGLALAQMLGVQPDDLHEAPTPTPGDRAAQAAVIALRARSDALLAAFTDVQRHEDDVRVRLDAVGMSSKVCVALNRALADFGAEGTLQRLQHDMRRREQAEDEPPDLPDEHYADMYAEHQMDEERMK